MAWVHGDFEVDVELAASLVLEAELTERAHDAAHDLGVAEIGGELTRGDDAALCSQREPKRQFSTE